VKTALVQGVVHDADGDVDAGSDQMRPKAKLAYWGGRCDGSARPAHRHRLAVLIGRGARQPRDPP
jgi:hypothetical protein